MAEHGARQLGPYETGVLKVSLSAEQAAPRLDQVSLTAEQVAPRLDLLMYQSHPKTSRW